MSMLTLSSSSKANFVSYIAIAQLLVLVSLITFLMLKIISNSLSPHNKLEKNYISNDIGTTVATVSPTEIKQQ